MAEYRREDGRGNGKGKGTDHHHKDKKSNDGKHRQTKMTEYTNKGVHEAGRGRGSPPDSTSHRTDSYKDKQHGAWSQNRHQGAATTGYTYSQRDSDSGCQQNKKPRPHSKTWQEVKSMFMLRMAETVEPCQCTLYVIRGTRPLWSGWIYWEHSWYYCRHGVIAWRDLYK